MPLEIFLKKIFILLPFSLIFVISLKNIKIFILIYVAIRSFFAIFYNIEIFLNYNILEIISVFFQLILLIHWVRLNFKTIKINNNLNRIYFFILVWILISTIHLGISRGTFDLNLLSSIFRYSTGFMAFLVFPIIFRNIREINQLVNAFFIGTLFPLAQGIIQSLFGSSVGGMSSSILRGESENIIMYYGFYHKYDGYAMAAIIGGCILIYKMNLKVKSFEFKTEIFNFLFLSLYLFLASLTLSRILVIDMIIIIIFMVPTIKRKKSRVFAAFLIFIIFLSSGFLSGRFEQIVKRSDSEFKVLRGEINIEYGFHGRVGIWKNRIEEFNQRSFLERLVGTNLIIGPHGDYMQWLLSFGYVGLFLYIFFLIRVIQSTIKAYSNIIKENSILRAYGLMTMASLFIWIIGAFIYNSSAYPEFSYFIIGNSSIFLSLRNRLCRKMIFSNNI